MRKLLVFGLMLGTVAAWNTGCSGDDDDDGHQEPVSIAITGGAAVTVGSNLQLTATATFEDASTEDITSESAWTTNSAANATVGAATGLATGVSSGPATITATHDGVVGTVNLTVSTGAAATSTLTFTGSAWPHNGSNAFVRILEGTTVIDCQESAVIAGTAFSIDFGAILTQGTTYTYETFADLNGDNNYEDDVGGSDHRWRGTFNASSPAVVFDVPHGNGQATDVQMTWVNNAGCPGT